MQRATSITASALGIYAGILGVEHGVFETLQGTVPTDGIMINAMGASCQADMVWHACFPALTLIPNFLFSGVLTILIGLLVLLWSAAFIRRQHGGLILIVLSLMMLLVGGGFVPTFIGVMAGIAGTRLHTTLPWWHARRTANVTQFLAKLWPWPLIMLAIWAPGSWVLGHFFNQVMLKLGFILFVCTDLGLPLLGMFSSFAHDTQHTSA